MKTLIDLVKERYPQYADQIKLTEDGNEITGELKFKNPRYSLWMTDESNENFIVGINFLHSHFDLESPEENRKAALAYIEEILQDEIVAIGIRDKSDNYILATMDKSDGIGRYTSEKTKVEIVSFSREY